LDHQNSYVERLNVGDSCKKF